MHGRSCQVPDGDDAPLALGGWSCKDLSKLSTGYTKGNHTNVLEEQRGTSGTTFPDLLSFLDAKRIKIFIGENVEDLTSIESQNRAYVEQAMWPSSSTLQLFQRFKAMPHAFPYH